MRKTRPIRLWSVPEAEKVLPYVRTILLALREKVVAIYSVHSRLKRLARQHGRPNRSQLVEIQQLGTQHNELDTAILNDVDELRDLGVYVMDPIQAEAAFRFDKPDDHRDAILVYSAITEEMYWRYQGEREKHDLKDV